MSIGSKRFCRLSLSKLDWDSSGWWIWTNSKKLYLAQILMHGSHECFSWKRDQGISELELEDRCVTPVPHSVNPTPELSHSPRILRPPPSRGSLETSSEAHATVLFLPNKICEYHLFWSFSLSCATNPKFCVISVLGYLNNKFKELMWW